MASIGLLTQSTIFATAIAATSVTAAIAQPAVDPSALIRIGMNELIAAGAPGVVVVAREGDKVVRLAAGVGNLSSELPLLVTDRMRIGSLAKSYVAVVVLQLVGEGKLALDETVEELLPGRITNGAEITVRELLNHTSGIFDYWQDDSFIGRLIDDPTRPWSPDELVDIAALHPRLFDAGESWSYSNTNYVLLGRIIEAATGQPLASELASREFIPLSLKYTSFDESPEIVGSFAHGYAILGGPQPTDVTLVSPTAAWAAGGGLVSTADDVAAFYAALMTGRLLAPDLLNAMLTTVPADVGLTYGLGIGEIETPCGSAWGHQGEFPGYLSFALTSRNGDRQAVVLVNFYSLSDDGKVAFRRLVNTAFCG
jgi:D-alanyl-D-alanine carboxypeptidase